MNRVKLQKALRVKNKIQQIKNFRWLVVIAFMASFFMIGFSYFLFLNQVEESFVPIAIYLSTTLGVWIILFLEYLRLFKSDIFLSRTWEERQIKKYLKKDKSKPYN